MSNSVGICLQAVLCALEINIVEYTNAAMNKDIVNCSQKVKKSS